MILRCAAAWSALAFFSFVDSLLGPELLSVDDSAAAIPLETTEEDEQAGDADGSDVSPGATSNATPSAAGDRLAVEPLDDADEAEFKGLVSEVKGLVSQAIEKATSSLSEDAESLDEAGIIPIEAVPEAPQAPIVTTVQPPRDVDEQVIPEFAEKPVNTIVEVAAEPPKDPAVSAVVVPKMVPKMVPKTVPKKPVPASRVPKKPAGTPKAQPLPKKVAARPAGGNATNFRLLILQRSRLANLDTRLRANRESWVQLLGPEDRLLTFFAARGQTPTKATVPDVLGGRLVDCEDGHGLICVAAEYHRIALPLMEDYDAMFVVDDDTYVIPSNLRRTLRRLFDKEGQNGTGFGIPHCGVPYPPPARVSGWCGGAGFGLSRVAALKLLETPLQGEAMDAGGPHWMPGKQLRNHKGEASLADGFVNQFLQKVQTAYATINGATLTPAQISYKANNGTELTEDVVVGSAWKDAGIPFVTLPGTYAWNLNKDGLTAAIHTCQPLPAFFHYVNEEKKIHIHAQVTSISSCDGASFAEILNPSYADDLAAYVKANGMTQGFDEWLQANRKEEAVRDAIPVVRNTQQDDQEEIS